MNRIAAAVLAVALAGCGSEPNPTPAEIQVEPGAIVIRQADSVRLVARVIDADGAALEVPLAFESADTSRVKVSSEGVVKSVGDSGFVTVMVRAGHLEKQVRVTVVQIFKTLSLTATSDSLPQLGTLQLTATVLDPFGRVVSGAAIGYFASNSIVSVSSTGVVTSQGAPGLVTVTAFIANLRNQVTIEVFQVPSYLYVSPEPVILPSGGRGYLDTQVFDAVGFPMYGIPVTFVARDPSLVTPGGGTIVSLGPVGTTTVDATYLNLTGSGTVTVVPAIPPVAVDSVAGAPTAAAVSPADVVYVVTQSGTVERATLSTFTFTTILQGLGYLQAVAFNPSGSEAYVGGDAALGLRIIDAATGTVTGTVGPLGGVVTDIVVDQGGIVYVSTSAGIYAIDPVTKKILDHGAPSYTSFLALHPTAPLLYASGSFPLIREMSTTTLDIVRTFDPGQSELAVSDDGSTLYSAGGFSQSVTVIDLVVVSTSYRQGGCVVTGLLSVSQQSALYLTCGVMGGVNILDLNSGIVTGGINTSGAGQMALSPDGLSVVIPGRNGEILLIQ